MAFTITAGTGSSVAAGTNPTPTYPSSGLAAGKLALLAAHIKNDAAGTLTPPAGWTQQGSTALSAGSDDKLAIWQRVLDGTETAGGTVTVTSTGSAGRRGAGIIVIDGTGTGWNFEAQSSETGTGTTVTDRDVTTTGTNRLALNFVGYSVLQTLGQENFLGETGGSWVASAYFLQTSGPTISVQSAELASAGTIGGGSDTSITGGDDWITLGVAIYRNATTQPDLVVDDFTWSPGLAAGEPTVFSANIHNTGTGDSPSSTSHRVRFEVSGAAIAFSTSFQGPLVHVSGSAWVAADGTWVPTIGVSTAIVAIVDDLSLIAESNEGNNTLSKTTGIIYRPNLRISDILWTPTPTVVGNNVQFAAVIENPGTGASPVTAHVIKFEISGTEVATATGQTASIAVSAAVTASADGFWVPSGAGTFSVTATIDPTNAIKESNETDNSRTENITIDVASGNVTSFAGRGGAVVPIQADYDAFFLTQAEGDDLFTTLAEVTAACYDKAASDAKYLTQTTANSLYLTQAQADAQGMPAIESTLYSDGGTPMSPISHGTGNITLRIPTLVKDFIQRRRNTGAATSTVLAPAGYSILGTGQVAAGASSVFVKVAGGTQFLQD